MLNTKVKAAVLGNRLVFSSVVKPLWFLMVLIWPVLKWVISLEVFFQLARVLWYWDTPGVYAGWVFLLHFVVLTALTYFVSIYKPRGL